MRNPNRENEEKYLLIYKPEVTQETKVFCCLSITTGNLFISIILIIIALIDFLNSFYSVKLSKSITKLINGLAYSSCGGCLLYGIYKEKKIYIKFTYILYQIIFFLKLFAYAFFSIIYFILIFIRLDWRFIIRLLALLLLAFIELGIMAYFIYVIYCYLVTIKHDDNNNNINIEEENQELLKSYKEEEQGLKEINN